VGGVWRMWGEKWVGEAACVGKRGTGETGGARLKADVMSYPPVRREGESKESVRGEVEKNRKIEKLKSKVRKKEKEFTISNATGRRKLDQPFLSSLDKEGPQTWYLVTLLFHLNISQTTNDRGEKERGEGQGRKKAARGKASRNPKLIEKYLRKRGSRVSRNTSSRIEDETKTASNS